MSAPDWIDCHFHVFSRPRPPGGPVRYLPAYGSSHADWVRAAPAGGARRGVLVQTSFLGTDNTQLLDELRAHPQQLRGVAVVDPLVDRTALDRLHEAGVRGVRLNLAGAAAAELDAPRLPGALADDLAALGWNVELHADAGMLPRLLERIDRRLVVVLDHFGKPAQASADDATLRAVARRLAAGSAAVYVKLSGAYRLGGLDAAVLARLWRDVVGAGHLLWGSDWPCTNHERQADYPRLLAALEDWIDDADERRRILVDNPLGLYWR